MQATRTRAELLAAGIKVFAEHGFHRARLEDIAAAADTTRGALYWHFKDKEDLLAALLENIIEHRNVSTIDDIPLSGDAVELLASSFVVLAEINLRVPWFNRLINIVGNDADNISPRIAKLMRKALEPNRYWMARLVKYGQETGVFRTDVDASQAGVILAVLRTGLGAAWYMDPKAFEPRQTTEALFQVLLPGLLAPEFRDRRIDSPKVAPAELDAIANQMLTNYGATPAAASTRNRKPRVVKLKTARPARKRTRQSRATSLSARERRVPR
jgi:TetR/AcrR family acrAB operon transcriptional repressor